MGYISYRISIIFHHIPMICSPSPQFPQLVTGGSNEDVVLRPNLHVALRVRILEE